MNEEEEIYSLNDKDTIVQTVKTSLPYKPPPPPPPPRPARPARNLKIEIPAKFFTEIEGNTISKEPVNIKAISADLSQIPNDHINQHGEPEIKIREEVGTKKGKKKRRKSLTALIEGRLNPHSTQGANIQVPITPEPKQSHSFFKNDSLSSRRIKSLRMKEPLPFSQSQKVNMPQRPEPVNRIRNLKNFQSEMCNQTDILEQKPQSLDDYTNPNGDRNQLKRKLENNFTRANIEKNLQLKMVKETQQKETPKLAQFRATRKDTISKLTSNWSELESQILEKPENQENQLRWSQYTNTNIESIRIRSLVNSARICEGVSNHMKNIEELLNDFKTSSMKRKVPSIDSPPSSASSNFNSPPVANTPVSSLSPRPRSPSFNSHYLYSSSDSSLQPRVPPLPVPSLPPSHPPPPPPERKKLAPKEATAKLTTSSESTSQSSDIPEIDTKDESLEKVNAEDLPAPIISPRMPIPLNSNEPHPPVPNYPPPPLPIPPVPTPKRERTAVITTPPSIMSPINKPPPPPPLKTKKRLAGSHPLSSSNSDSIIASPRLVLSAQPANFNMSAPDSMVGASSIAVPPLALSNMHDISNLIMFNAPNTQHGQNTLYMNTLATPNTSLPISIPFHSSNQPSSSGLSVSAPLTSLPPPSFYLRAQCQPPPPPPQSPPTETPLEAFTSPRETKESTETASTAIQEPSTSSSNVGNGEVMLRQKIHDPKKRKDRKSKKFSWLKKQTNPSEQKGRNFVSKILSEGDQSLTKDKFVQQLISQTKLREILDEKQLKSLPTLFFAEFQAADDSQNIEFDKKDEKSIVFCTIFKLIEKVTQKEKKKDPHLLSVFLLTFRNLISAQHLLELLVFRAFAVPPDEKQHSEWISKHQIQIQTKIISILTKWIKLYSYDFEPPYMSFILSYFVSFLLNSDHPFADSAVSLLFRTIGDATSKSQGKVKAQISKSMGKLELKDLHPTDIARQLALAEFEVFESIKLDEFSNGNWCGTEKEKKAPNILRMVAQFNQVSNWVASEILKIESIKERAVLLHRFIIIAEESRALKNYNSVMAILSGLQSTPIFRLKRTWNLLPSKSWDIWDNLNSVMSNDNNFANYRNILRTAESPFIPYIGVFLTDLVFVDDGNSDYKPKTNMINMAKLKFIASILFIIERCKLTRYDFTPIPSLQASLLTLSSMSEEQQRELSLQCEPRN